MKPDFELILDDCLAQMRTGRTLQDCLAAHPDQAERLRPLLEMAAIVTEIPIPRARPAAVQAGKERMLAIARTQGMPPEASEPLNGGSRGILGGMAAFLFGSKRVRQSLALRAAIALVVVLLATSGLTVTVSASSLPGDRLYSVKRAWESIRLALALSQQSKQQLRDQYAAERRGEVKALIQRGRGGTVEFQAPLEEMSAERWLVDGFQVYVGAETVVEGQPATGWPVDIRARLEPDGTLNALQVHVLAGSQSTPSPKTSPAPSHAPIQGSETPQVQPTPHRTPRATATHDEHSKQDPRQPSPTPVRETTPTDQVHPKRSPEPTEWQDHQHTPEPTEFYAETRPPRPTWQHTQTPESTDFHHETHTSEPTWHHHETPRPTDRERQTPEPTEEP